MKLSRTTRVAVAQRTWGLVPKTPQKNCCLPESDHVNFSLKNLRPWDIWLVNPILPITIRNGEEVEIKLKIKFPRLQTSNGILGRGPKNAVTDTTRSKGIGVKSNFEQVQDCYKNETELSSARHRIAKDAQDETCFKIFADKLAFTEERLCQFFPRKSSSVK